VYNAQAIRDVDSRSPLALSTKCVPAQTAKRKKAHSPGIAPSSVYLEPMWGFENENKNV
jgi:hypothetical protein